MPATITIPDFFNAQQTVNTLPALGGSTQAGSLPVAIASNDPVTISLAALQAAIASNSTAALQTAGNATLTGIVTAITTPQTAGGQTIYRLIAAATTNAQLVKSSAGQLYSMVLFNGSAGTVFVKLYNTATAPTAGAGTPVMTIGLAAGASLPLSYEWGIAFSAGIGLTITGAAADADTTAVAAGVIVNLGVK